MFYETSMAKNPYKTMQSKPKLEKCPDLKKQKQTNIKTLFNHKYIKLKILTVN